MEIHGGHFCRSKKKKEVWGFLYPFEKGEKCKFGNDFVGRQDPGSCRDIQHEGWYYSKGFKNRSEEIPQIPFEF